MQIGDVTDEQLDEPADTNKEGEAAVTRINSLKSVIQNNFCGELLRNGVDHTSGCHRRSLYVIADGLVDSEAQCEVIGGSRAESGSLGSRVGVEERLESGQSDKESCEQGVGSNGAATELCYLQQVEGIGAHTLPGQIVLNNLPCNADRSGEVDSSQFSQSNDIVMLGADSTVLSTQALSDCDKPDTVPDSTDPSTEQESSAPVSIEANVVQLSGSGFEGVAVDGSAVGDVALEAVAMEGPAVEGVAVEGPAVEAVAMEGPTVEGPAVEGVAMEGPAVEGPAVQGVAMEGPAVEGVAVEGVAMEGPAVEGEAVEGPTVEGVAMEGPAVEGGAVEGPAVEGVATTYLYYPVVSAAEGGVSRVYSCRWRNCAAHFLCLEDLVIHINDDHVKLERPQVDYTCHWDGCPRRGKGFNARYKMLIHIRTHTNEKPHTCFICGKGFSRLENLKIHNRSHTGEKPYPCPFQGCHKAYSNSSDRFKHVRTHQVEKPYRCKTPGCDKRYTDPSSLRKHVRKHGHFNRGDLGPHCQQPCCGDQGLMGGDRPGHPGSASTTTTQLGNPAISSASVISIHGNIMHISGLASNPLLSSTIVNVAAPSQGGDNSTDTVQLITIPASLESPSKDSSLSVLEEPRCQEGPLDPRCQEGPLDLSTSPDITAHASDDTTDVVQCAFSVCGKWELATIGAD